MPIPIPVVLVGAGQRGAQTYATFALRRPEEMRIAALVEPDDYRRDAVGDQHNIPYKRRFREWGDLLDAPPLGDVALVTTPDYVRVSLTSALMNAGYHVLIETPMALNPRDCLRLLHKAETTGQHLILAHSLRYTAFYRALHDILKSGRVGEITSYKQERLIPSWYAAHQFVRNPDWHWDENPMMMLEGIHEFDLMAWMIEDSIEMVSSVGSMRSYRVDAAPMEEVPPQRCVDDCPIEEECPFSAVGTYLQKRYPDMPQQGFPHSAIAKGDESPTTLAHTIENQAWGECVYHADVSIVDHQDILLKSTKGLNLSLNMRGHGTADQRSIHIDGSQGALTAEFIGIDSHITYKDHATNNENTIKFRIEANRHGGDHGLMGNLCKLLRDESESLTTAQHTVPAHLLAFAAEKARLSGQSVNFRDFWQSLEQE